MNRKDVDINLKWKLEDIFPNPYAFDREFLAVNLEFVQILRFKGKLKNSEDTAACLNLHFGIMLRLEQLYAYAFMHKDENVADSFYVGLKSKVESIYVEYSALSSFITPELSALSLEEIDAQMRDAQMKDYDYLLEDIKRSKQHILSDAEEKLLSLGGETYSSFSEIFSNIDNVDLPFGEIKVGNEKIKVTHGVYSKLLVSSDGSVRKKAFEAMYKAVKSLINTTAACYTASVKKDNFLAKARNYSSAQTKSMEQDNVPTQVYDKLLEMVNKNLPSVHKYVKLRKEILNVKRLNMYDLYVPLCDESDISYEYEDAFKMVLEGLKPMGKEYGELLLKAKNERWIDVYETENKRSGAYSCGVAGIHPYVLLNYSKTTHDVFTIAHELGHSLHSYYSSQNQPYSKADYSIFVAEVASTVNEVLLIKHLIAKAKDVNVKKYLLSYYLDMFRTTIFRQAMFAEFESKAHTLADNNEPLTVESLSQMYYGLNAKYYGKSVYGNDEIRYEWARIPHFYSSFYVYKYSTGMISAVSIAKNILENNGFENYKKFLSAGGSYSPYEILRDAGVDLLTNAPYESAFSEFDEALKQLKELYNK